MKTTQNDAETARLLLSDRKWRLDNLYYITDKRGVKQFFKRNSAQSQLYDDLHYCNIVLKARQLGITTFITLLFLDTALFNSNVSCGIIADTEENAKYIFRKIKYAYDCLPEPLKAIREAKIDSAKELTFSNNSLIRVGTSLRSATFQYLLISEFGKIAAEDIKRTNEILTGSLNTIAAGSYCFIESTARGREGAFYNMCVEAQKMRDSGKSLSQLDYKFHFLPWHKHPEYSLVESVHIPEDLIKYFKELQESYSIKINPNQMAWYAAKYKTQGDDMLREYPSTPEEAFQSNLEGHYYSKYMTKARVERRIGNVPHDQNLPVFVAMDLGFNDAMALWWYQKLGSELRLIDYYENSGEPLNHYIKIIKNKPYITERVFAPHDASSTELGSGLTRVQIARNLGLDFTVLPRLSLQEGIDSVRNILNRCWFDEVKCEKGIRALENYRKEWNETLGTWRDHPRHDHFSNGADAFRYVSMSIMKATTQKDDEEEYRRQLRAFHEPQHALYGDGFQMHF
ncbi:MAG: terminase [Parachlamydiaceae bacterium]